MAFSMSAAMPNVVAPRATISRPSAAAQPARPAVFGAARGPAALSLRSMRATAVSTESMVAEKMSALGDRVLIVPEVVEEKSEGGILLPGNAGKEKKNVFTGLIMSVGPGVKEEDFPDIKAGANVLVSKYSSSDVALADGTTAMFVPADAILAVVS